MCYAIPGKLMEIKGNTGIVDYFGEKREAHTGFIDVEVGDWVYAQGGVLISKATQEEAAETLNAWKELFFELKKIDREQARIGEAVTSRVLSDALKKIERGEEIGSSDISALFGLKEPDDLASLYKAANNIRANVHGNACCVHGIIEFSNFCANDCLYCGIRKSRELQRYRMSEDEIVDAVRFASKELGFKALVLQSGDDPWYDEKKLIDVVSRIREFGVLIFLSIGDREKSTYKNLYDAGARAALLRFETSNDDIFGRLRPGKELAQRLELIREIKSLGYVLATGFIIGLPGEKGEDLVNNILLARSLTPSMYSFGPFIPAEGGPLSSHLSPSIETSLKTIAISRLADRDSNILVTTALETLEGGAKKKALLSGANSLMLNVTPNEYKPLYAIYANRAGTGREIRDSIKETLALLRSLGRAPIDIGVQERS